MGEKEQQKKSDFHSLCFFCVNEMYIIYIMIHDILIYEDFYIGQDNHFLA